MTCTSAAARGHTILKVSHNIGPTATLRNYQGDRMFSAIRSLTLIQCSDKEWNSRIWRGDM